MPIRPPPPISTYGDLARARQIARSWTPIAELPSAEFDAVVKAIAQGIAEGRSYGLDMDRADLHS